jgi:hypothetical protein
VAYTVAVGLVAFVMVGLQRIMAAELLLLVQAASTSGSAAAAPHSEKNSSVSEQSGSLATTAQAEEAPLPLDVLSATEARLQKEKSIGALLRGENTDGVVMDAVGRGHGEVVRAVCALRVSVLKGLPLRELQKGHLLAIVYAVLSMQPSMRGVLAEVLQSYVPEEKLQGTFTQVEALLGLTPPPGK